MPVEAGLVGLASGLVAGVMGVGGGIIIIPGLVLISGMGQHSAQGISLAAIVVTGLVGTIVNYRQHLVQFRAAAAVAPAAIIFALLAGALATTLDAKWLGRAFGLFQLAVGLWMLFPSRRRS